MSYAGSREERLDTERGEARAETEPHWLTLDEARVGENTVCLCRDERGSVHAVITYCGWGSRTIDHYAGLGAVRRAAEAFEVARAALEEP